jgi:hypothetical protein
LSPVGVFYLVAIKQNKPLEIIETIQKASEGRLDGKVGRAASFDEKSEGFLCRG